MTQTTTDLASIRTALQPILPSLSDDINEAIEALFQFAASPSIEVQELQEKLTQAEEEREILVTALQSLTEIMNGVIANPIVIGLLGEYQKKADHQKRSQNSPPPAPEQTGSEAKNEATSAPPDLKELHTYEKDWMCYQLHSARLTGAEAYESCKQICLEKLGEYDVSSPQHALGSIISRAAPPRSANFVARILQTCGNPADRSRTLESLTAIYDNSKEEILAHAKATGIWKVVLFDLPQPKGELSPLKLRKSKSEQKKPTKKSPKKEKRHTFPDQELNDQARFELIVARQKGAEEYKRVREIWYDRFGIAEDRYRGGYINNLINHATHERSRWQFTARYVNSQSPELRDKIIQTLATEFKVSFEHVELMISQNIEGDD